MADFTKVLLIVLGVFSLGGGIYGAIDTWPSKPTADQSYQRAIGMLEVIKLMDRGLHAEANKLEAEIEAKYGRTLTAFEVQVRQYSSYFWIASGLVSWAVFWGLATIISELALLRSLVAKELAMAPNPSQAVD